MARTGGRLPQHDHDPSPRFGLRPPLDTTPTQFKVLVSTRWLWSALLLLTVTLASALRYPRLALARLVGGGAALSLLGLGAALREASSFKVEQVSVPVVDLPPALDGLRIAQLSDLHLGWIFTARNAQRARAWLDRTQPDLIAITGDFVGRDLQSELLDTALAGIAARHGVYAVLGNHDYWVDVADLEQHLSRHGIQLLRNEVHALEIDGATLHVAGIDCAWESRHDIAATLGGLPAGAATLVLAHEPDVADDVARYPVMLQLSGHTHAGHFALPGLGPAFLPRHGMRYFRSLHRVGSMWLYVSRGLGGFPLRFGVPPEVTLLTLRRWPERSVG